MVNVGASGRRRPYISEAGLTKPQKPVKCPYKTPILIENVGSPATVALPAELSGETMSSANHTDTDPVMDVKTALERLGSEKLLKKVASVFKANAAKHTTDIEDAIAVGDSKKLEMAAHTLVSSMAYLSASSASEAAMKLEHMGRDGVTEGLQAAHDALMVEIDRLAEALIPLL